MLEDILAHNLDVVFCNTAGGRWSARLGAYYARTNDRFWPILHRIGLTPRLLNPREYRLLPAFGLGLADLAWVQAGQRSDLDEAGFDTSLIKAKIRKYQPKILCFNGKAPARHYLGSGSRQLEYGLYRNEMIGPTLIYVVPSTAARSQHWDEYPWFRLAKLVRILSPSTNDQFRTSRNI